MHGLGALLTSCWWRNVAFLRNVAFFARLKGPRAPPCLGGMMGARHRGSFPAPKSFAFLLLHALLPAQFKALGLAALRLLGMSHCQCVVDVALPVALRRPRPTSDRAQLEPSVLEAYHCPQMALRARLPAPRRILV